MPANELPLPPSLPLDLPVMRAPDELERLGCLVVRPGKRPTGTEQLVRDTAARAVLSEIMVWLDAQGDGDSEAVVLKELAKVSTEIDGFRAAEALRLRFHWDVDSGLVELLDRLIDAARDARHRLTEIWVRETGVAPTFERGSKVRFEAWRKSEGWGGATGEVTEIDEGRAVYTIYCEELGHVRQGVGTHGLIVPFESVRAA